ncbi:MAG: recombinase family protein [Clostridia bacterium]|nr:recombinase family protein [Clostridia bacterium]
MKRVLCLYRVSTKGQVDPKDDIPMQRRECLDFIAKQDDWVFFDERLEKGVSGFKVSTAKRDVIIEIREMAERKMFDVLLVFMFDRLGRRDYETPFLVQWFIEHGIEVWSSREGQQRLDNQSDRLMNFIRFWQAGGESEKTAMRVKASHTQMTADGIWRGGQKPFGYKLVHNGRIGKKNRPLYDLIIDEIEGPIVKEIFDLVSIDGMGILRIANHLNEKYPHLGKVWTAASIRTILHNIVYTGRLHMNDTVSQPIESLRLISDAQFEFVQYALKARIPRKYEQHRKAENDAMPVEAKTKASVYGATMLSGILYCAHCGKKLVGSYCTKQLATGAYHRPIYRCYNGSIKAKNCDGQTVYSAQRIEEAVHEVVRQYFHRISTSVDSVWREQTKAQIRTKHATRLRSAKAEHEKLQAQQVRLKQEVLKSLTGDSMFEADLLKDMLAENKAAIAQAEATLTACQDDRASEEARLRHLMDQYQSISDWSTEFETASSDTKKMILARIIEKITVDRNYNLHFSFFITEQDFEQQVSKVVPNTTVSLSENFIPPLAG